MVNINLRQAILLRVYGKSEEELQQIIHDSIDYKEEALPGLGVLFEMIWKECDESTRQQLISHLHKHLANIPIDSTTSFD
ncbi:small acid-soluble spore protein SspI [Paenibacillus yanchengensis]|uniref:Small, acid-soluble spore protein I n=1 Tax=Paenibacillus yanchengensis TaxID=2035833 RepID=A0ABW4YFM6_9BACL